MKNSLEDQLIDSLQPVTVQFLKNPDLLHWGFEAFRLGEDEHVVGFVHLGTPQVDVPDRDRPALADLLSTWTP